MSGNPRTELNQFELWSRAGPGGPDYRRARGNYRRHVNYRQCLIITVLVPRNIQLIEGTPQRPTVKYSSEWSALIELWADWLRKGDGQDFLIWQAGRLYLLIELGPYIFVQFGINTFNQSNKNHENNLTKNNYTWNPEDMEKQQLIIQFFFI